MQCRESDNCDRDVEWHTVGIVEVGNLNDYDISDRLMVYESVFLTKCYAMDTRKSSRFPTCAGGRQF